MLCPSLIDSFLGTLSPSNSSALHSAKVPSTYTIRRNTHRHRCSLKDMLFISMRVLSVQKGQLSCEGLPPPLGCPIVDCRAAGEINQRLDGSKGCSRGRESLLCPRGGFCLVRLVKSTPWSLLVNSFTVLNVEEVNTDICKSIDAVREHLHLYP